MIATPGRVTLVVMRWVGAILLFAVACGGRPGPEPVTAADTDIAPPPGAAQRPATRPPDAPRSPVTRQAPRPAAPHTLRFRGRRIDLDLKEADLHNVFRLLAEVGAVNIVVADDVSGRITLRLRSVPWDQVLHTIAASEQLVIRREGDIYLIQRQR